MILHDITRPLDNATAPFPGDPPFAMRPLADAVRDGYRLSGLSLTNHTGTHLDAPAHLFPEGKTLDDCALRRFLLPCRVVAWPEPSPIPPEALDAADLDGVEAVLFKTANSALGSETFARDYVWLRPDTARLLTRRAIRLVGIDYASVDGPDDHDLPAHRILLAADALILENTILRDVDPGLYTLSCFPLRLRGADGAPCRAVLIEP